MSKNTKVTNNKKGKDTKPIAENDYSDSDDNQKKMDIRSQKGGKKVMVKPTEGSSYYSSEETNDAPKIGKVENDNRKTEVSSKVQNNDDDYYYSEDEALAKPNTIKPKAVPVKSVPAPVKATPAPAKKEDESYYYSEEEKPTKPVPTPVKTVPTPAPVKSAPAPAPVKSVPAPAPVKAAPAPAKKEEESYYYSEEEKPTKPAPAPVKTAPTKKKESPVEKSNKIQSDYSYYSSGDESVEKPLSISAPPVPNTKPSPSSDNYAPDFDKSLQSSKAPVQDTRRKNQDAILQQRGNDFRKTKGKLKKGNYGFRIDPNHVSSTQL